VPLNCNRVVLLASLLYYKKSALRLTLESPFLYKFTNFACPLLSVSKILFSEVMKVSLIAPLFFSTVPASSLFILLLLYTYPDNSAATWPDVFSAVAAYPAVQWQIIINPNSGPGTSPEPPYQFHNGDLATR